VQVRRYPVAVSAENLAIDIKPLGTISWEGRQGSTKRKSEDRPDTYGLHSTSLGELKSKPSRLPREAAAYPSFPAPNRPRSRRQGASHAAGSFRRPHLFAASSAVNAPNNFVPGLTHSSQLHPSTNQQGVGKRGETPPLPRNCKRREPCKDAQRHWSQRSGKTAWI
jgi:hypothetical protein